VNATLTGGANADGAAVERRLVKAIARIEATATASTSLVEAGARVQCEGTRSAFPTATHALSH
jgi:hypothetical protein